MRRAVTSEGLRLVEDADLEAVIAGNPIIKKIMEGRTKDGHGNLIIPQGIAAKLLAAILKDYKPYIEILGFTPRGAKPTKEEIKMVKRFARMLADAIFDPEMNGLVATLCDDLRYPDKLGKYGMVPFEEVCRTENGKSLSKDIDNIFTHEQLLAMGVIVGNNQPIAKASFRKYKERFWKAITTVLVSFCATAISAYAHSRVSIFNISGVDADKSAHELLAALKNSNRHAIRYVAARCANSLLVLAGDTEMDLTTMLEQVYGVNKKEKHANVVVTDTFRIFKNDPLLEKLPVEHKKVEADLAKQTQLGDKGDEKEIKRLRKLDAYFQELFLCLELAAARNTASATFIFDSRLKEIAEVIKLILSVSPKPANPDYKEQLSDVRVTALDRALNSRSVASSPLRTVSDLPVIIDSRMVRVLRIGAQFLKAPARYGEDVLSKEYNDEIVLEIPEGLAKLFSNLPQEKEFEVGEYSLRLNLSLEGPYRRVDAIERIEGEPQVKLYMQAFLDKHAQLKSAIASGKEIDDAAFVAGFKELITALGLVGYEFFRERLLNELAVLEEKLEERASSKKRDFLIRGMRESWKLSKPQFESAVTFNEFLNFVHGLYLSVDSKKIRVKISRKLLHPVTNKIATEETFDVFDLGFDFTAKTISPILKAVLRNLPLFRNKYCPALSDFRSIHVNANHIALSFCEEGGAHTIDISFNIMPAYNGGNMSTILIGGGALYDGWEDLGDIPRTAILGEITHRLRVKGDLYPASVSLGLINFLAGMSYGIQLVDLDDQWGRSAGAWEGIPKGSTIETALKISPGIEGTQLLEAVLSQVNTRQRMWQSGIHETVRWASIEWLNSLLNPQNTGLKPIENPAIGQNPAAAQDIVTMLNQGVFNRYFANPVLQALGRGEIVLEGSLLKRNQSFDPFQTLGRMLAVPAEQARMARAAAVLNSLTRQAFQNVRQIGRCGEWEIHRLEIDLFDEGLEFVALFDYVNAKYDFALCLSDLTASSPLRLAEIIGNAGHLLINGVPGASISTLNLAKKKATVKSALILSKSLLLRGEGLTGGIARGKVLLYPSEPKDNEDVILIVTRIDDDTLFWIKSHPQVKGVVQMLTQGNLSSHINLTLAGLGIPRIQAMNNHQIGDYFSVENGRIKKVKIKVYNYEPVNGQEDMYRVVSSREEEIDAELSHLVVNGARGEVYVAREAGVCPVELYWMINQGKIEEARKLYAQATGVQKELSDLLSAMRSELEGELLRDIECNINALPRAYSVREMRANYLLILGKLKIYFHLSRLLDIPILNAVKERWSLLTNGINIRAGELISDIKLEAAALIQRQREWSAFDCFSASVIIEKLRYPFFRGLLNNDNNALELFAALKAAFDKNERRLWNRHKHEHAFSLKERSIYSPRLTGGKGSMIAVVQELRERFSLPLSVPRTIFITTLLCRLIKEAAGAEISRVLATPHDSPQNKISALRAILFSKRIVRLARKTISVVFGNEEYLPMLRRPKIARSAHVKEDIAGLPPGSFKSVACVYSRKGLADAALEVILSSLCPVAWGVLPLRDGFKMAVPLQEQVEHPDVSGVIMLDSQRVVINAAFGLFGATQEETNADLWTMEYGEGAELHFVRGEKKFKFVSRRGQKQALRVDLPLEKQLAPCLAENDLKQLLSLGNSLYRIFRHPIILEFALKNGEVILIQPRWWQRSSGESSSPVGAAVGAVSSPIVTALESALACVREWKAGHLSPSSKDKEKFNLYASELAAVALKAAQGARLFLLPLAQRYQFCLEVFDREHFRDVNSGLAAIYQLLTLSPENGTHLSPEVAPSLIPPDAFHSLANRLSRFEGKLNLLENRLIRFAVDNLLFDFIKPGEKRLAEIMWLVSEIEKELSKPGTGKLPVVVAMQDLHAAGLRAFALVGRVFGLEPDIYRRVTCLEDLQLALAEAGIKPEEVDIRFVGFSDVIDRGDDPEGCIGLVKWLRSIGKLKFIEGNHDDWVIFAALCIYNIAGVDKTKKHGIGYWSEETVQHAGWLPNLFDQINQRRLNAEIDRVNIVLRLYGIMPIPQVDVIVYRSGLDIETEKKRIRVINEQLRNTGQADKQLPTPDVFSVTLDFVRQEVKRINQRIARIQEEHGPKVAPVEFREVNAEKYMFDPDINGYALWLLQNFRLFYIDVWGSLHTHNLLPLDFKQKLINVIYKGKRGFAALEQMEEEIRDFFEGMEVIPMDQAFIIKMWERLGEAFTIINNWYSDTLGVAKAKAVKEFVDFGGPCAFGDQFRMSTQRFAERYARFIFYNGHNDSEKFQKDETRMPWLTIWLSSGSGFARIDGGMSKAYEDRGVAVITDKHGLRKIGFPKAKTGQKQADVTEIRTVTHGSGRSKCKNLLQPV
ncbi:MAG: hypothetical protein NT088_03735 [Candidatus Omnitrophica bacterium]|nr:hypothetical protein [Candidatus Omnitrophota bacterium]